MNGIANNGELLQKLSMHLFCDCDVTNRLCQPCPLANFVWLIYFDDVPKNSWSAIKYLREKVLKILEFSQNQILQANRIFTW